MLGLFIFNLLRGIGGVVLYVMQFTAFVTSDEYI